MEDQEQAALHIAKHDHSNKSCLTKFRSENQQQTANLTLPKLCECRKGTNQSRTMTHRATTPHTSPSPSPFAEAFLLAYFIELRGELDPSSRREDHVDAGQATVPGVSLLHMLHRQHHPVLLGLGTPHAHHGTEGRHGTHHHLC